MRRVVVTGLGIVGLLGAKIFQSCGYQVLGCDPDEARRELAAAQGLEYVYPALPLDDPRWRDQVALAIANARLRQQSEQAATLAERQRLARELHDAVTQTLFSANLIAEVLPQLLQENPGLLYTSPSPRDRTRSRMPSSA